MLRTCANCDSPFETTPDATAQYCQHCRKAVLSLAGSSNNHPWKSPASDDRKPRKRPKRGSHQIHCFHKCGEVRPDLSDGDHLHYRWLAPKGRVYCCMCEPGNTFTEADY